MGTVVLADVTELETVKISELTEATDASGSDIIPAVISGATNKISKNNYSKNIQIGGDDILYVTKEGDDSNTGTIGDPFLSIQAACDYAIANMTGDLAIKVYPGTYTEQIHATSNIHIVGIIPTYPIYAEKLIILYNTGADADHYPMRCDDGDVYHLQNMTIRTDANKTFGKISNSCFRQCRFEGGYFIEGTEDIEISSCWDYCAFADCKGFNLTGVAPNGRDIALTRCWFGVNQTVTFESTHTVGDAIISFDIGTLKFTKGSIKGDWSHYANDYHSYGDTRHEFDTTGDVVFNGVTITNGIHFLSAPSVFKMVGCSMEDEKGYPIPAGTADVTSDVIITNVDFQGNSPYNGLCGNIQTIDGVKDVGGGTVKYLSLQ